MDDREGINDNEEEQGIKGWIELSKEQMKVNRESSKQHDTTIIFQVD